MRSIHALPGMLLPFALQACSCSLPGETGDSAPDTSGQVEILRDSYGVPHIYGGSVEAAMYGFGYAQAEDHLSFMLTHYLAADGRLCTALEAGDEALALAGYGDPEGNDLLALLFRFREVVDEQWDDLDQHDDPSWSFTGRELLTAFAAGVNAYMAEHPERVPDWWSGQVEPQAVLAFVRATLLAYQVSIITQKASLAGEVISQASNEWVVGPGSTADDATYVQSDPHLAFSGGTLWYEAHLAGGPLDVAGATMYGVPFIAMGHNRSLAFTETSNSMDNADLFQVTVSATDPTRYVYGDQELPFTFSEVTRELAGGGERSFRLAWTHHGPVVDPLDSHDFAAGEQLLVGAVTMLEQAGGFAQFVAMDLAPDVDAWVEAMQALQIQRWNFVVGDTQGDIFFVNNSRHPARDDEVDWSGAVDGSDPELDWTTAEPWAFDELAWARADGGYFQCNNSSPGWITADYGEHIDESAFPGHYFTHDKLGARAEHALRELSARSDWTFEELQELSMSTYVLPAAGWIPLFEQAWEDYGEQVADPAAVVEGVGILQAWDYQADVDSTGMTLYNRWMDLASVYTGTADPPDSVTEEEAVFGLDLLGQAVGDLQQGYGSAEVPWGEVHRIRRGEVDLPIAGGTSGNPSLFMATATEEVDGVGYVGKGSSYMLLTRLGADGVVEAVSVKPWGNSEDPESPHYSDLTELYAEQRYKEFWYDRQDVEQHLESTTVLEYLP